VDVTLLPNIVWHCLAGPQARFAAGAGGARRYARGFSPIAAFADPLRPDFASMAPHCDVDEHVYFAGWGGVAPAGWRIELDSAARQMTWERDAPPEVDAPSARRLEARDVPAMLELVAITRPGPFAERTIELGEYWGVFDGDRLVAMAGERMAAATLRELSGVCTHPDFQGRGLARRLVVHLLRRMLARGERPFLHVMVDNPGARALYERLGFRLSGTTRVRVVSRIG
jgi:GNAT superfamily N-acetyltransferase